MQLNESVAYMKFKEGNETFRVPESGYFFNNTDCWARIHGDQAWVGISDFIRLDPRKIVSFEPPEVGLTVAIFDGLCAFETDSVSLNLCSPVSGSVVSVNRELLEKPELIKEDPYERGWVALLELSDIEYDMGFLADCDRYFSNARARLRLGPRLGCPCSRRIRADRSEKAERKIDP